MRLLGTYMFDLPFRYLGLGISMMSLLRRLCLSLYPWLSGPIAQLSLRLPEPDWERSCLRHYLCSYWCLHPSEESDQCFVPLYPLRPRRPESCPWKVVACGLSLDG